MKKLKLFFALFAMLALGVGNAWAETGTLVSSLATISSGDTYYIAALNSGKYYTVPNTTIAGQTFTCTQGSFSNNTLTPSSGAGEFVFTAVDGVANAYYIYNTNLEKYLVATGSKKFGYVTSSSSDYGYWTFTTVNSGGFSGVFSVKHSDKTHYMRAYNNSVRCYDGASNNGVYLFKKDVATTSYTVSYNSNGGSGTMSSSTGSSITILDCSFTAPNGKKFSKWNTEDDGSGTSYNPGAVVTEDLTLFAIWEDLPKYTVTLKDDESTLQQTTAGEVVVLPSREGCDGYTFAGWTASWTAPQTAWTTTAPTIIAAGEYTPTANVNLYPVYTQTENASGAVASLNEMVKGNTLSDGDKIVIVANGTNVAMYQETISSSYVNKWDCSTLTTATVSDDSKKWWTVTLTDGGFYLGDATNGYLNFSSNNLYCNSTKSVWTLSDLNNGTFKLQSGGRNLSYRSDLEKKYWRMGGASYGESGVVILKLYKYVEGNSSTTSYISVPDCSAAPQPAVLVSIEKTAGKTEFTEGDTFEKATITATYDDETKKDVTSLATFTGYDMNTTGTQTVTVTYEGITTTYKITVNPKPTYTITWNNAGTTNTTKVVQGEAFGTLPKEPEDCPSGKKFMGWTAAPEVNNDGSGIVYVEETDIPTGDKTYYAVFAVEKVGEGEVGSADVTLSEGNFADSKITWDSDYATIVQEKVSGSTAVNGSYVASPRWYVGHKVTITPKTTINITAITINQGTGDYAKFDQATATNASIAIDGQTVTITPLDGTKAVVLSFAKQVRPTSINIAKGPATTYSDYSLNCDISVEPTWTISKNEIAFADKYVDFEYTETFTINASNLAEDIDLAIDGSNFTVLPTSIAADATFPQTVTVTYAPTAAGSHNATLNITSGLTLSKAIALTGSAEVAKIYTQTPLAEITKYDEVLIVGTNNSGSFAMANNDATSTGPKAVKVTIKDNTIATTATNIQWQIGNTDGVLVFSPKDTETWLYCNDSNNGLRIGKEAEYMDFEIKDNYIYNTDRKRYVGIYDSEDWRSYEVTTGNIKDQTFAFYIIKGEIPDNVYTITYETNGGNTISPATDVTTIPNVLPTPTKAGMNFAGWYIDQELTTPATPGADLAGNTTLYAKWVEPYTVAEARTLIAADTENKGITAYVQGIVTAIEEINTTYGNATYTIGDTEDAVETLKIYRGHYLNDETFTDEDQLKVKDQVVIYGTLINHNTGGYQFNQGNYIYKLTSATGKETTTLSWSATTCKVQIGATNTFPTLTKSHDITIKYTSSNTSVATIANDGSITLVAAGTTTITAAIEEDATYAASSASYELTVVEVVPTGIFQLYSGELVEGEYVLVDGAKDKALKAAVAGNTRLAGEDVTIADDAILNPDASIVWNVAKSGTDWTIYNEYEEKYVAGGTASAAQLLADGSDQKALWTITGTETYDIVNNVNEASSVNSHLRWGGSYWACYGATTGKALRLYKKIDVPTPTISLASGTYIGTQTATVSCALATATIYYTTNGETPSISSSTIAVGGSISITESCTLKVIAVANTKESSVVETTYKIIPDGGIWVLVDDATSLQAGDLVVIASKENNAIAGKIEEGKDYMTSVNDAEFSTNKVFITKLPENAMKLTLGGSAGAWTLEYQQLYLNASGANNSLGADATTTWNITIDESANATIAYDVYAIRYNKSNPRFKSYNSTNGIVLPQIYKYTTDFYTRNVTNKFGTICLPFGSTNYTGAEFFECVGKEEGKVYIASVTTLVAGTPYIFLASATEVAVYSDGTTADEAGNSNGLYGTFTDGTVVAANDDNHILLNNELRKVAETCWVNANRAYLVMSKVPEGAPTKMPGRRYIGMDVEGENEATGLDNIQLPNANSQKLIINGQLIIIRDGEMYNAQGQKL